MRSALGAALAATIAAEAYAQATGEAQQLPEVTVSAPRTEGNGKEDGYAARRAATATRTDTPLAETPQSVTVVTRERMEDMGATSVQDALNYAAGVRSDAYGLDTRTDSVRVRGGYPDEYRDGLRRQLAGYYTSSTRVDPYVLERIEVLRGPASMLFGQGTTAGILNYVSKRPQAQASREVGVQLGSFDRRQVQADLAGPITGDARWAYRLVALAREADTQVDHVPDDRRLLAPSLAWRIGNATTFTLQAHWQQDRTGSTLQFQPWSGTVSPNPNGRVPTSRFLGEPGFDHYDSDRAEGGWLFEHRFGEHWTLRHNLRVTRNEVDYGAFYPDSYSNPGNSYIDPAQRVLDRFVWIEVRRIGMVSADQHVEGRLATGPVRHQVLLGVDAARFSSTGRSAFDFPASLGGTVQPIDAFDPVYAGYTPPPLVQELKNTLTQAGAYLQDQVRLGERWIVVAGLRHDRATNRIEGGGDEDDRATSRRFGLLHLLGAGWSPYVSYSESFTPLAGTDLSGNRFKPLRGEQTEAGAKWEARDGTASFTAAAYDLKEKNRQVNDPANPLNTLQVGRTKTRGFELELLGRLVPALDLAAHYNYTDLDEQLEALPRHQAAIWGTGRFALGAWPGFKFGLGVRYLDAFRDGAAPTTPSVTLVDAMFGWSRGPWRAAVNVANVADKVYASTCLARGDCFYGARRTVVGTLAHRW
jgi:iron complex outermembrane receptor protein